MSSKNFDYFGQKYLGWLNSVIAKISVISGGALLVIMMFFMTTDVFLRYFFNRPVAGSNELVEFMMAIVAASAFLYTAIEQGHINVDLFIIKLSSKRQAVINSITTLFSVALFALLSWGLFRFGNNVLKGGDVSGSWFIPFYPFVYATGICCALICLVLIKDLFHYISQFIATNRWQNSLMLVFLILIIVALFSVPLWGKAFFLPKLTPTMTGLFGIIILLIVLFSGMAVGTAMALVGFLGFAYMTSTGVGISMLGSIPYFVMASYGNSIIPLFILMGAICFTSGLSKDLYYSMHKWLGHLSGGLSMATVGACAAFAAVSGSSVATASTMGTVAIPEMKAYKYDPRLATGCVVAGATIGVLIPPSIALVIYGLLTEQSIGKLFLAGFIPGIMEALVYIITIAIICKLNPSLGPKAPSVPLREKIVSLKKTWGVLALFILVLGGIYIGAFTPTEAAGIGAFGAFVYSIGVKGFAWGSFKETLRSSLVTAGMALFILLGGKLLGQFFTITRIPFELASMVTALEVSRYTILFLILLAFTFMGAIMSVLAMLILVVPIVFPVIISLGFDPIWFGIIIVKLMELGQITPPVGVNLFVVKGVAKDIPLGTVIRGTVPFIIADLFLIIILIVFPQTALFLPSLL